MKRVTSFRAELRLHSNLPAAKNLLSLCEQRVTDQIVRSTPVTDGSAAGALLPEFRRLPRSSAQEALQRRRGNVRSTHYFAVAHVPL